jgi:hypothetical protein
MIAATEKDWRLIDQMNFIVAAQNDGEQKPL